MSKKLLIVDPSGDCDHLCIENQIKIALVRRYGELTADLGSAVSLDDIAEELKSLAMSEIDRNLAEGKYYSENFIQKLRNRFTTALTANRRQYMKQIQKLHRRNQQVDMGSVGIQLSDTDQYQQMVSTA